jgi:hypothetical protein
MHPSLYHDYFSINLTCSTIHPYSSNPVNPQSYNLQ